MNYKLLVTEALMKKNYGLYIVKRLIVYIKFSPLSESKVLQYFDSMKHEPAAQDAFAEAVKMTNHTGL